jgi:hypothetical protein
MLITALAVLAVTFGISGVGVSRSLLRPVAPLRAR